MQKSRLVSEDKFKIGIRIIKICLLLTIFMMGISNANKDIYADDIGVPENISIEIGNMKFQVYYFTGDNCKNIEFRKTSDSDDQKVKIRVTDKQVGDGYAYYAVQYFGYEEGNVYVYPYDVNTGTTWNGYQIHVQAPQIEIDSCNGREMEFSFYTFSDDNLDIGYTESVYHGNGLEYTKTMSGGYPDSSDQFNTSKTIWRYRYDCKLTLYTNGTYRAILYNDNMKTKAWLNLNIHDHEAGGPEKENIIEPTCGVSGSYNIVLRCKQCNTLISSTSSVIPATGNHNIVSDTAIEPTCTEDGKTEGSHCSVCGQILKEQRTIPATGHQYGDYTIMQYPTCTSSGYKVRYCLKCGNEEWTYLPLTDHTYAAKIINPTCTIQGYTVYTCVDCGARYYDNYVSETGHNYGKWKIIKEATCDEDGKKVRECITCGETDTEVIEALGHNEVIDAEIPATCTEEGKTEGSHCERCGKVLRKQENIPTTDHKWSDWKVIKEPTCTDKGSKTRVCNACGVTENIDIEATGHAWGNKYTVDKEATCTTDGEKSIHCTKCDATKDKQTIPASGHEWGEWKVIQNAKCTQNGSKMHTCVNCGYTESTNIEATDHVWEDKYTVDKEATCTTDGSKSIHCSVCGISKNSMVIPTTGHNYGKWENVQEATVFVNGIEKRKCLKCNDVQERTIAKLKPTIKISKTNVKIKVKKSIRIKVSNLAKGDSVQSWKTSNKKIVTVSKAGKIKAKKKGKATITVVLKSGKTAKIKVTVKRK